VVRVWGEALFTTPAGQGVLGAVAANGPIAAARMILMLLEDEDRRVSARVRETGDALRAVFAHFPGLVLADARGLLARFTAGHAPGADDTDPPH
jgi:hypothetical protein